MIKNIILSAKKKYFNFKLTHFGHDFLKAVALNKLNEVELFLTRGVDFQDEKLNTALHIAATHNLLNMVKLLLEHHANPNMSNLNYDTPLLLICCVYQSPPDDSRYDDNWHFQVSKKVSSIIKSLVKAGADVEATNKNNNIPLVLAIRRNYDQGVKHLLANGANPLKRDGTETCSLEVALSFKKMEIVQYIYHLAKDIEQVEAFTKLNSLYPATKYEFLPLLKSVKLKLSLEKELQERENSNKLRKI